MYNGIAGRGIEMDISIVIPTYNEEENIKPLYDELREVLGGTGLEYEVIFVDDGSSDATIGRLHALHAGDNRVKIVKLKKNFGQSAAMAAGFDYAHGNVIITMDADLQNDPADIPSLLQELDKGHDVVCGWRRKRKDTISKKAFSRFANWLRKALTGETIHDSGCTLRAYRSECLKDLELYGEMHRYIPAILSWKGYSFSEVVVSHRPRTRGVTKYGVRRIPKGFLDLLLVAFWKRYSLRPIHILGGSGLVLAVAGFILSIYLVVERLFFDMPLADRPIFLLAILMVIIGIQFLVFGVLADILIRVYNAQSDRKVYTVDEVIE